MKCFKEAKKCEDKVKDYFVMKREIYIKCKMYNTMK